MRLEWTNTEGRVLPLAFVSVGNFVGPFRTASYSVFRVQGPNTGFAVIGTNTDWIRHRYETYYSDVYSTEELAREASQCHLLSGKWDRRMICLVCGKEIEGFNPLADGLAKSVHFFRHDQIIGSGYAHHEPCAFRTRGFNVTGEPDYGNYEEYRTNAADGLGDPVKRGAALDEWALLQKA